MPYKSRWPNEELLVPASQFNAATNSTSWNLTSGWLQPAATGTNSGFTAGVFLPEGSILHRVEFRGWRDDADDTASMTFRRVDNDATLTTLATLTITSASSAWQTIGVDLNPEDVDYDDSYYEFVSVLNSVTVASDARIMWCKVIHSSRR